MGVGLLTQDNFTSKEVCDASKRTYAGTQLQSCEALPGDHAQCDNFYVCDASGQNCNPCQSYKFASGKNMGRTSGNHHKSCMPMPGNCNNGVGWQ